MHLGRRAVEVYAYYPAYPFDLSFVDCVFKGNSQYAIRQVSEEEKDVARPDIGGARTRPPTPFSLIHSARVKSSRNGTAPHPSSTIPTSMTLSGERLQQFVRGPVHLPR